LVVHRWLARHFIAKDFINLEAHRGAACINPNIHPRPFRPDSLNPMAKNEIHFLIDQLRSSAWNRLSTPSFNSKRFDCHLGPPKHVGDTISYGMFEQIITWHWPFDFDKFTIIHQESDHFTAVSDSASAGQSSYTSSLAPIETNKK